MISQLICTLVTFLSFKRRGLRYFCGLRRLEVLSTNGEKKDAAHNVSVGDFRMLMSFFVKTTIDVISTRNKEIHLQRKYEC